MKINKIYFDNAATTKVDKNVLKSMMPYFSNSFGNSSSIHSYGQKAEGSVLKSRDIIAKFLNCRSNEVIFTSGATEANNTVLKGVFFDFKGHLITSAFEHPCVLETAKYLQKNGVEVDFVRPEKNGIIDSKKVLSLIKDNTRLVSIMYANNEIGTIQPIGHIGKKIRELNQNRQNKVFFHTDAVQATQFLQMNVERLYVDFLSMSSHKIYGPKGMGAFYVRKETRLKPLFHGGHHEYGLRAGTLNVPGIIGFSRAIELIASEEHKKDILNIQKIRDYVVKEVLKIDGTILNGDRELRIPNNANFLFKNVEGESLLLKLDMKGIAISTGSACASGSLSPSHVLLSMGIKPESAHGSMRISLGKYNTIDEAKYFVKELKKIVKELRKYSPLK